MGGAAAVRAGGAYVEIFARDGAFQQAMHRVQMRLRAVGQTLQRVGTGMSLSGIAIGGPMVLAARQAATFEDAILGLQAAAGLGQADIARLSDEAKRLSASMGAAPESIAQAFLELAKAGMSVEEVMAGAGKSAVEFARISGVDAERAAVFMKAAMNVFGVSAQEAVNTLSSAADSSETSIAAMIESFSQVGSAGKAFNQTLFGISQAMAVLAKSNIIGEEAGTAIKTVLTKLVAPTQDATEALAELGLTIGDFRDAKGNLLPLSQIAGVFEQVKNRMGGDFEGVVGFQKNLVDVFEQRGIKVITAFANAGTAGFDAVAKQMLETLPVSEKFTIVMSGITGQFERMQTAIKLVSIEFGTAILPALQNVTSRFASLMTQFVAFIQAYPQVATGAAAIAAGLVGIGTAAIALGVALRGLSLLVAAFAALASPAGAIAVAATAVALFAARANGAFEDLEATGIRLYGVWRKLGAVMAAAAEAINGPNADETWINLMFRDLPQIDAEVRQMLAAMQARRAAPEDLAGAPAAGAAGSPSRAALFNRPAGDAPRPPLGFDPAAKAAAAAALAEEDLKDQLDLQRTIAQSTDAMFKTTKGYEKLGSEGEKAFQAYFDALAQLQQRAENGMNLTVFEREAAALDEQFGGFFQQLQDKAQSTGIFSAGTFGSGEGLGIGPALNPLVNPLERIAGGIQQLVQLQQAAAPQAGGLPLMGPDGNMVLPDLALGTQAGGALRGGGIAAAVSAAVKVAQGVVQLSPEVRGGLAIVAEACQKTTDAVLGNNKLLDRMLTKMDGVKLKFE